MTCLHCKASSTLFLCNTCTKYLGEMLTEMPWLLSELQVTRQRQDRLTTGVVGKGRNPSPIHVGAMELARQTEEILTELVGLLEDTGLQFLPKGAVVPTGFIGPLLPGWHRLPPGYSGSPIQRAKWLHHHIDAIARHPKAKHFFDEISSLVGDPDHPSQPGRLVRAINRSTRIFVGPCPHVVGHDHEGKPLECGLILYCDEGQDTVTCPRCAKRDLPSEVNVARNRLRASVDRDLMTEPKLLETMETIGEPVTRYRFLEWVSKGRLRARGFIHAGQVVERRVRRGDPRVWSLSQTRQLRWRDLDERQEATA